MPTAVRDQCRISSRSGRRPTAPFHRSSFGFLVLLITNALLLASSPASSTADAAAFEVIVSKPSSSSSTTAGSIGGSAGHLFQSKYLGNSVVSNAKNLGYTGKIVLGTPSQSFNVVFDTGSDMIVITSDQCQGQHCSSMPHYTCNSCTKTPYSYNITYGDGTWGAGPIVADTVAIGGLVIQNQQILDVTKSALDLSSYGDGIAGLVGLMPSSPVTNAIPPLETIYKNKLLDMNVFSVYLTPSLKASQGGSFLFGGIDNTKFSGQLNYIPVSTGIGTSKGMWYADADGAFTGNVAVAGYTKSPWLFDTGTSFIAVPTSFAQAFHANIPGAAYSAQDQFFTLPCSGNATFAISFNGVKYEVPYLDYVARSSDTQCVSLVMPLGNYEMFILGDPFLRQVYVVYDFTAGASKIGLAPVNVTSTALGNEGLSGDPIPGGTVITPVSSNSAQTGKDIMSLWTVSTFAMTAIAWVLTIS
ncbi:Vacuolar protease A [Mortierella claussenii]|nr:Vacuolar protease A [Mortierella claussenii]